MMTIETPLAKELAGFQYPDDSFLALIRNDDDLDPAFLNVKYRIRGLPLGEDDLILLEFRYRFADPDFCEKALRVKRISARLACHIVLRQLMRTAYAPQGLLTLPAARRRVDVFEVTGFRP
jgi:hypothetical protein